MSDDTRQDMIDRLKKTYGDMITFEADCNEEKEVIKEDMSISSEDIRHFLKTDTRMDNSIRGIIHWLSNTEEGANYRCMAVRNIKAGLVGNVYKLEDM